LVPDSLLSDREVFAVERRLPAAVGLLASSEPACASNMTMGPLPPHP
jgi:hypothetical protein